MSRPVPSYCPDYIILKFLIQEYGEKKSNGMGWNRIEYCYVADRRNR